MKLWHLLLLLAGLLALLILLLVLSFVPGAWGQALSLLAFLVLYGAPFFIGEEMFDVVDKRLDAWSVPEKKLPFRWHLLIALLLSAILFLVWPAVSLFIVGSNNLDVGEWLRYSRPLQNTQLLFAYPRFAVMYGIWGAFSVFCGYAFESVYKRVRSWTRSRS